MARFRNVSKQDLEVPSLGREVKAGVTVDVPAALRGQFDESPLFEHVVVKKSAAKKKRAAKTTAPAAESTPTPDAAGIKATTAEGDGA